MGHHRNRTDAEREAAWLRNQADKRWLHEEQYRIAEARAKAAGRTEPAAVDFRIAQRQTAEWSRRLWNW